MQVNSLQMFVFVQSLVTKIKFPSMELSRNASAFRSSYKRARGLRKNASTLDVLRDVRDVCAENNLSDIFTDATKNHPDVLAQL